MSEGSARRLPYGALRSIEPAARPTKHLIRVGIIGFLFVRPKFRNPVNCVSLAAAAAGSPVTDQATAPARRNWGTMCAASPPLSSTAVRAARWPT